jgi:regulator of nucleoside diphosphate kinase
MQKIKEKLVLSKNDYEIIMANIRNHHGSFNGQNAEELRGELKKARLVLPDEIPGDVVRLNSRVIIRDEKENKLIEICVVTPEKADMKQRRISVLSPIGTALIGYRKGDKVRWKVPAGLKTFTILEVEFNDG